MMLRWARRTCGMMGRSPDFMNVTFAAWAGAARFRRESARVRRQRSPISRVHPRARRHPDALADQPAAQPQRVRPVQPRGRYRARSQEGDRRRHRCPRGSRILATLGPLADEIAVYSPRMRAMGRGHSPFALNFAIPCGTPGLRFLCRDSFDLGRSHFDHPLGSRFEEMDCVVFFDDVLVPWERVFLLGDVGRINGTGARHPLDGPHRAPGRREEHREVRVRARCRLAGGGNARQRTAASFGGETCRADAVHGADEGVHTGGRSRRAARRVGRDVSGGSADRDAHATCS